MRVMEVISDSNIGGAGILLLNRLTHSNRDAIQTTVVIPRGSLLKKRFECLGIPMLEMRYGKDRSIDLRAIRELMDMIRKDSPVLINCHGCFSARIAAWLCRTPVRVYTRHCAYPVPKWQTFPLFQKAIGQMTEMLSHHVIAVADAAKKNLLEMGIREEKIVVVINGAEPKQRKTREETMRLRTHLNIPQDHIVVGISARLEACKDHACFLRAAQRLCQKGKRMSFLVVGDGSLREELEHLAAALGISSRVIFVGFAEDVTPYLNLMDIHVNCSIGTETSSLAISEAMSLGIPTVASAYGGNPYLIRSGENGFLYPPRDDAALAKKLEEIADDPTRYQRLSNGAKRRFFAEFHAATMTKNVEALYEKWEKEAQKRHYKSKR